MKLNFSRVVRIFSIFSFLSYEASAENQLNLKLNSETLTPPTSKEISINNSKFSIKVDSKLVVSDINDTIECRVNFNVRSVSKPIIVESIGRRVKIIASKVGENPIILNDTGTLEKGDKNWTILTRFVSEKTEVENAFEITAWAVLANGNFEKIAKSSELDLDKGNQNLTVKTIGNVTLIFIRLGKITATFM